MNTYAVDFETSYTPTRGIRSLGTIPYLRHPDTDVYLVSIIGPGVEYVGPPENAPWDQIVSGMWISHNASFDRNVYAELRRRSPGKYPDPPVWNCSSDMCAYIQCRRALKDAMKLLEGVKISKAVRTDMLGVEWTDLDETKKREVAEYALNDSRYALTLWTKYSDRFPEFERRLSRHTTDMTARGIGVDLPKIERGIETLRQALFRVDKLIPWAGELDEKGKEIPITSPIYLAEECHKLGIPAPSSTSVKSPLWNAWVQTYESKAGFIRAIQAHRKFNRALSVLTATRTRTIDGSCYYELKYGGAPHTLRWSGGNENEDKTEESANLNMQNLPKEPVEASAILTELGLDPEGVGEDVDVRSCYVARPGKVLVISDLAQIEARGLAWLTGNEPMLELLRGGMDMYEAHARTTMGYTDPRPLSQVNKPLRALAKIRVLSLGYKLSNPKRLVTAAGEAGVSLSVGEAEKVISDFRKQNKRIVDLWNTFKSALSRHGVDGKLEICLPSGRTIRYFDVSRAGFGYTGRKELGGSEMNLWEGLLTENTDQGLCRDVFGECLLASEDAGYPAVLHAHDEAVHEIDRDGHEEHAKRINRIMSTAPDWAEGLPVASGTDVTDYYCKK